MINFKKNSIFSRDAKEESVKKEILHGGVLAVWGSPGSGKTTTAVKLAKYLADKKKNVILVLCDMTAPMLPCICPPSDLECEKSLGSILSATHVTEPLVKYNMITHKKMAYLTIIGMLKGENEYTYASYSKVQAMEFIESLRKIAPFVIIDCSSYIANDILSAVSLLECDSVLRLANCDLKSISYLSSQLSLLQNSNWDGEQAGIEKTHSVMGRILKNILYLGNDVYPAIIDKETFDKAEEIRNKRAKDLGRIVELAAFTVPSPIERFKMRKSEGKLPDDPITRAEYLYSLIESEV